MPADYFPVLVAFGIALLFGAAILGLSALVGGRSGGRVKLSPYESGEPLLDRSRKRISILFFLVAIDFVIFDVEAAFLYPWVLVLRDGGWPLFWAVMVFMALILIGLVY
ncbi:MAG: NADH-quinone oxidoreductase subunit A, partial [Thermoanaerobaculia bacterium]